MRRKITNSKEKNKIKGFFRSLGPGFITGASDDDPSGIATYSQTGAIFGYGQLWSAIFTLPLMIAVQEMCGRIGLVTGKSLSSVLRSHYSKPVLAIAFFGLIFANTINIGSDLGAMASSAQLLFGMPFYIWLIGITIFTVVLQVFVPYPSYARFLKYMTLSLFAYIVAAFVMRQPWSDIAYNTFVPKVIFSREYIMNIVAIFGTTISPYLFFWEADQESEEDIENKKIDKRGRVNITSHDIKSMRLDTAVGMFFSNLVMFFIMVTSASALGASGISSIETADQAAQALRPLAGEFTYILFTLGIVGTGLLAIPVLAGSAAYALSETLGWKAGLHNKFSEAKKFYLVILVITIAGVMINLLPIPPFKLLYYTAVTNGLVAPVLIVLVILTASNKKIMGSYISSRTSVVVASVAAILMALFGVILVLSFIL